ncbi:hypothetical protein LINGRAHAP2_LOCUS34565 [Linum grandiflorum]
MTLAMSWSNLCSIRWKIVLRFSKTNYGVIRVISSTLSLGRRLHRTFSIACATCR